MTKRKDRSTAIRKIKRRVPSGESREYFRRRQKKPKASCALCRSALRGIGSGAKTERRPNRKFAGNLCHRCSARILVEAQRVREKTKSLDDVELLYRKYVQGLI
ncbi:MAG: 50S ribosomal protein L34e [Candidatus Micrarchaeota archaeon]